VFGNKMKLYLESKCISHKKNHQKMIFENAAYISNYGILRYRSGINPNFIDSIVLEEGVNLREVPKESKDTEIYISRIKKYA